MARQLILLMLLSLLVAPRLDAGTFLVEDSKISFAISEESIIHPFFYVGQAGERVVRVCILPTSDFIDQMTPGLLRAIDTFNTMEATTENFVQTSEEVPLSAIDYESMALHELLHCAAGVGHTNVLPEITPPELSTDSFAGDDGMFTLNPGGDTRFGTFDDMRGDDVNRFWFQKSSNDPFTVAPMVDASTYSRELDDLPAGHSYAANGNFLVAGLVGFPNLQAVMERTQVMGSETRKLAPDDTVNIRYGMSGLNEAVDATDDYTIRLEFVGVTEDNCEVLVRFDPANPDTTAACFPSAILIGASATHFRLAGASNILLNSDKNWYFGRGIFADGFESGDTFSWSSTVPP